MKHFIALIALVITVTGGVQAQNSLEFSNAILVNSNSTVPTGKVWKVVGVAGTRILNHVPYNTTYSGTQTPITPATNSILINGNQIDVGEPSVGAGAGQGSSRAQYNTIYASTPTTFPLWLPAGTTLDVSTNVSYISVVEFNVQ